MTDICKVTLIGRLVLDAETKAVGNSSLTIFAVACNSSYKKGEEWVNEVSYFDVNAWKISDKFAAMLTKGKQVAVNGTLKQERWEKDGQKYSRVVITSESIQPLGDAKTQENNSAPTSNFKPVSNEQNAANAIANAFGGTAFPEDLIH